MLEGINITKYFGSLAALKNVNFKVNKGEIVGLIGPNGSGKTTLFNVITGFYKPNSGRVIFNGHDITGLPPHKICKLGIARTFQIVKTFLDMSVLENVVVGALYGGGSSLSESLSEAQNCLEYVGLKKKSDQPARALNICERKLLAIAQALSTKPKLILLDEPLAGLNPKEIIETREIIKSIRDDLGITVFWVEHIMGALRGIVDRVIVLDYGRKIAEGKFEEITRNKEVINAYLGEEWMILR